MIIITAVCAFVVLVVCIALVLHKDYEDGLIGRLALATIGLASMGRLSSILERGWDTYVSHVGVMLWVGLSIFLARHLYYFLRRRYGWGGVWRESNRAQTAGKQRG